MKKQSQEAELKQRQMAQKGCVFLFLKKDCTMPVIDFTFRLLHHNTVYLWYEKKRAQVRHGVKYFKITCCEKREFCDPDA